VNLQDVRGCVEFGIITIRADEYTAVLERLPARLTIHGGKHLYEFCRVPTARGGESGTAVVRCLEPGQGFAQSVTRDLIDDLNPKWLLLVGIAGGIPSDDFTLGDVLLASRVHDFSVSAANQDGVPQWNVGGGPVHTHVARLLSHLPACTEKIAGWNLEQSISRRKPTVTVSDQMSAQQLRGPDEWKEKILACLRRHYLPDLPPRPPLFWVGQAASSNTLVKDPGLLLQWLQLARAVTHVEMELAAVQAAARTKNLE
jgi:nucleoside phosphorylase